MQAKCRKGFPNGHFQDIFKVGTNIADSAVEVAKMTRRSNLTTRFVIIGLFILVIFGMNSFAMVIANESDSGFAEPQQAGIRELVMQSAGYFLQSQSDIFLFSRKLELSELNGVDYTELLQIIESAVANMEDAVSSYTLLTQSADSAPYDQGINAALLAFNYSSFRESRSLNSVIFGEVENYLNSGDIRGLYHKILLDAEDIRDRLAILKSAVQSETFPGAAGVWQVNESVSTTLLFGQYSAEIFYEILGK